MRIELDVNGIDTRTRSRAAHHTARLPARLLGLTGATCRLRARRLRRLHRAVRRRRRALVSDVRRAGGRLRDNHHRRGNARPRRVVADPGRVLRNAWDAMRLLHAGDDPRRRMRCSRTIQTPTREEIVDAISGNICRCTGYAQIVEAIALAAERMRGANRPRGMTQMSGWRTIPLCLDRPPRARGPPLRRRQGSVRRRRRIAQHEARGAGRPARMPPRASSASTSAPR